MNRELSLKANDKVKAANDPENMLKELALMKIILSPAKKMIADTDSLAPVGLPESILIRQQRVSKLAE